MTMQFRAILQAVAGTHKGLLVQILAVENDGVAVLSRAFDGTPSFFKIPLGDLDSWRNTGGTALVGPKPQAEQSASAPALPPPPLDPHELLEPLPPEVKAEPMLPKAVPLPPEKMPKKVKPAPRPPRPPAARVPHMYTVQNAVGDEAVIPINVRTDDRPERLTGVAFTRAMKVIPNVKPFTLVSVVKQ